MTAFNIVSQILIAVTGVAALAMVIADRPALRRWAPIVGLVGQPFWIESAMANRQYGMLLLSIAYTVVWIVAAVKEWRKRS